jgi:hypothetical protein
MSSALGTNNHRALAVTPLDIIRNGAGAFAAGNSVRRGPHPPNWRPFVRSHPERVPHKGPCGPPDNAELARHQARAGVSFAESTRGYPVLGITFLTPISG